MTSASSADFNYAAAAARRRDANSKIPRERRDTPLRRRAATQLRRSFLIWVLIFFSLVYFMLLPAVLLCALLPFDLPSATPTTIREHKEVIIVFHGSVIPSVGRTIYVNDVPVSLLTFYILLHARVRSPDMD